MHLKEARKFSKKGKRDSGRDVLILVYELKASTSKYTINNRKLSSETKTRVLYCHVIFLSEFPESSDQIKTN